MSESQSAQGAYVSDTYKYGKMLPKILICESRGIFTLIGRAGSDLWRKRAMHGVLRISLSRPRKVQSSRNGEKVTDFLESQVLIIRGIHTG